MYEILELILLIVFTIMAICMIVIPEKVTKKRKKNGELNLTMARVGGVICTLIGVGLLLTEYVFKK